MRSGSASTWSSKSGRGTDSDFINNMNKKREDKALARMALVVAAYKG